MIVKRRINLLVRDEATYFLTMQVIAKLYLYIFDEINIKAQLV
jgi:hypothetical protein